MSTLHEPAAGRMSRIEPAALAGQAAAIAGADHVSLSGEQVIVEPAGAAEAAALLGLADSLEASVTCRGSGSKLDWIDLRPPCLVLRSTRMNTVREHVWEDMTCTVESGCTWAALESALALHGQAVPLDPLWPERATVGGVVAANDSGALRLRYGGLRDLIIGMTVVLADGTVARSGGKVVKNVAGYDLPKLMCGSSGTLAFIAEVTFRLYSIPRGRSSFTAASSSLEAAGGLLAGLLDSRLSIESIQLRADASGSFVDVALASLPEVVSAQASALASLAGRLGPSFEAAGGEVWRARQGVMDSPSLARFKATMLPADIARVSRQVVELGGSAVTQASGVMTGSVPTPEALRALGGLRRDLEASRGSLTLLSLPPGGGLERWGADPAALPLMRTIKGRFDPRGILNPGSFVGGI